MANPIPPRVYIDEVQPDDLRYRLLVSYTGKQATIEVPVTGPLSAQGDGVETARLALRELLAALQAAVESPSGILWPHGRPPAQS
jgi:hypothetical protein